MEDFKLEQKNRFHRNRKDNAIDMIAQGEETIPEKDITYSQPCKIT